MNKAAALLLALCLLLSGSARAALPDSGAVLAIATNDAVLFSPGADAGAAERVYPAVYKLDGYNYFKLRDLAMLLSGSRNEFSVEYDSAERTVSITSGMPYEAAGGELTGAAQESAVAAATNNRIIINGEAASLTAYKIGGENYFRLRDLGAALDFGVSYDSAERAVIISGELGYEAEKAPGEAEFSARYIRTDGYIDGAEYPRVTAVSSAEELRRYYEENRENYDLSHRESVYADSTAGFADVMEGYDEEWFETHRLIIVLTESGSGSVRYEVKRLTEETIDIEVLVPEIGTADMAEWHILIETEKTYTPSADIKVNLKTVAQ